MLVFLSQSFDIYLGCFADNPEDIKFAAELALICQQAKVIPLSRRMGFISVGFHLLTLTPLTLVFFANRKMQSWIDKVTLEQKLDTVLVSSSSMLQYIEKYEKLHTVVDFIDVDSDKWRQYAQKSSFFKKWIFNTEYKKLRLYETEQAKRAEYALFVSKHEAQLFCQQLPTEEHKKVGYVSNGVNTDYFDPHAKDIEVLPIKVNVVFTGTMNYLSNVEAVVWFCNYVWPLVLENKPDASFYIVGDAPNKQVKELNNLQGVIVTGKVSDVRPYLLSADVVVAPMQVSRGVQNKILEAMAMAKFIVCSSKAIEGIEIGMRVMETEAAGFELFNSETETSELNSFEKDSPEIFLADNMHIMANYIIELIHSPLHAHANRQWALKNLQWKNTLAKLPSYLIKGTGSQ
jgi:sugar transferase (PEP-CTERM/EpsH1 system associated)